MTAALPSPDDRDMHAIPPIPWDEQDALLVVCALQDVLALTTIPARLRLAMVGAALTLGLSARGITAIPVLVSLACTRRM